jgi:nucleoside-diphosphate-sugar epimerase
MGDYILVTGGAGAIGSNLVKQLTKRKKRVVVLDNLSSGFRENLKGLKNVTFIQGDIVKNSDLDKAFSFKISKVFHLAAHFANQNSVDHPERDLLTNVMGTLKLLEYSLQNKVKKFVYASSSCVYGSAHTELKETFLDFKHDTPYAISKLSGEKYVKFFNDFHKLKTCIVRYFNVYGPGEKPGLYRNVIPNFFLKAMKGEPLTITGTGKETRDFTFVDDAARSTIKASETDQVNNLVINIASGKEIKILDLAHKINTIAQNKAGLVFKKRRNWDKVARRKANTSRARKLLGHYTSASLDEGLEATYRWLKQRLKV